MLKMILVGLALVLGTAGLCNSAHAQRATVPTDCSPESTGLRYVTVEGSGFASLFFFPFLLAMAPVAGPTDVSGQYRCHVAVIGRDAAGAVRKVRNRPVVEPQ